MKVAVILSRSGAEAKDPMAIAPRPWDPSVGYASLRMTGVRGLSRRRPGTIDFGYSAEEVPTMEASKSKSPTLTTLMGSNQADVVKLAGLLKAFAPHDGTFDLRVPGVHVVRRSKVYTELVHGVLRPSLCIVAQGAKRVMLGKETYEYDETRLIAVSVDLPVAAQVVRATPAAPFLGLRLDLDPHKVAELVLKVYPDGLPRAGDSRAVLLGQVTASIVVAATRLVELIGQAGDDLLGPLMIDEILIRLLLSPIGARIAQIGMADSGVDGVAKAATWDTPAPPISAGSTAGISELRPRRTSTDCAGTSAELLSSRSIPDADPMLGELDRVLRPRMMMQRRKGHPHPLWDTRERFEPSRLPNAFWNASPSDPPESRRSYQQLNRPDLKLKAMSATLQCSRHRTRLRPTPGIGLLLQLRCPHIGRISPPTTSCERGSAPSSCDCL